MIYYTFNDVFKVSKKRFQRDHHTLTKDKKKQCGVPKSTDSLEKWHKSSAPVQIFIERKRRKKCLLGLEIIHFIRYKTFFWRGRFCGVLSSGKTGRGGFHVRTANKI